MFDIADNYATVLSDLSKETVKLWDKLLIMNQAGGMLRCLWNGMWMPTLI